MLRISVREEQEFRGIRTAQAGSARHLPRHSHLFRRIRQTAASGYKQIHRHDISLRTGLDEVEFGKLLQALGIEHLDDARIADAVAEAGQAQRRVGRVQRLMLRSHRVRGIGQAMQVVGDLLEGGQNGLLIVAEGRLVGVLRGTLARRQFRVTRG